MNIFCYPAVWLEGRLRPSVATTLGVDAESTLRFGSNPSLPLRNGGLEFATEIDMPLGDLFVEAKLTELDFKKARLELIKRYRDFETVFEVSRLPWMPGGIVQGYQLIRNVLAAFPDNKSFCVLCDARRYDLIDQWYAVLSAVSIPAFACRLRLLTWQELSGSLPGELQDFLKVKYGIVAA